MNVDTFILIILLGTIFCLIFATVYFFPIFLAKFQASRHGLKLTFKQSKFIAKNYCTKKEFFIGVKGIWGLTNIPIEKLVPHFQAGGNLLNIKNGLTELKMRNKEIDFQTLAIFDLAGRNLILEVEKAEKRNWKFDLNE